MVLQGGPCSPFHGCCILNSCPKDPLGVFAPRRSGTAFMQPAAAASAVLAAAPVAPAGFKRPAGGFKRPGGLGGSGGGGDGGYSKPGGLGGGRAAGAAGAAAEPLKAQALHDPNAEGAVLLNAAQYACGNAQLAPGRSVSPVVVDPYIGRHLRPHQVLVLPVVLGVASVAAHASTPCGSTASRDAHAHSSVPCPCPPHTRSRASSSCMRPPRACAPLACTGASWQMTW